MGSPMIGLIDLGSYLRRDLQDDHLAVMACDAASQIVRDHCGQQFDAAQDDVAVLDGGREVLMLPQRPVTSIAEVLEDGVALSFGADYMFDSRIGAIWRLPIYSTFARGVGNIEVTYDHGYAEVPEPVRMVAVQVAARIYEAGIAVSETAGQMTVKWVEGMASITAPEAQTLGPYRRNLPA